MTFMDLPSDWASRPLTDPRLVADVLDLMVSRQSRLDGALFFLLCDDRDRLLQPVAIDELPSPVLAADCRSILSTVLRRRPGMDVFASVVVAIARASGLSVRASDTAWADAAAEAAEASGRRLLGVHVVTTEGSRPVVRSSAA